MSVTSFVTARTEHILPSTSPVRSFPLLDPLRIGPVLRITALVEHVLDDVIEIAGCVRRMMTAVAYGVSFVRPVVTAVMRIAGFVRHVMGAVVRIASSVGRVTTAVRHVASFARRVDPPARSISKKTPDLETPRSNSGDEGGTAGTGPVCDAVSIARTDQRGESTAMSTSKPNKDQEAARAALMIQGVEKHYANVASVTFAGASHTPAEIKATLQSLIDLRQAVNDARAAQRTKVAAERAQLPVLRSVISALATVVRATYGTSPDVLADFGLTPNKTRTPLTSEQKAAAAAKRKSTRAARHTMGPKQRRQVKGNVTGVVVTPVTISQATSAPSASSEATAPAASVPATRSAPVQGATATSPVPRP